ncbi:MAG: F0F1 ATP synthase subunit delta [Candidatus Pacebacteria bacterium]|nr:F0F1 ATP synthase subunit delta [Candidatus Paceibacterota bacterium]MBP9866909.1 F0F1 ATP synthase subunit delta [Candidatus Paceibacterota bacterium]
MTLSRKIATLLLEKNVSVDDVVKTLTTYNLLGLIPAIKESVIEMSAHTKSENTLAIESPFPLSDEIIAHIKKITKSNDVTHEITINKHILAGFKARYKGILYDGSAERIIRQLIK